LYFYEERKGKLLKEHKGGRDIDKQFGNIAVKKFQEGPRNSETIPWP
jgi:hypothetical protein